MLLGLTAGASATDAAIHKKMFGFGFTTVIISNEKMNNIMKIVKVLWESGLLIKDVIETIKNEAKEQKGGFLGILLGTLGASLLGDLLAGKFTIRAGKKLLMPHHPLTNFEILKYYGNDPKFNGFCSINNLPKIKDGTYIINLDEYESIGTRWIALYVNDNNATYFNSLGVEHMPKEIKKIIGNKNIVTNIYRVQAYDSIMCGYFCIGSKR